MGERINFSTFSVADFLEEQAPYYLSIGMTHSEYWNGAPELAQYSLKAFEIKRKREFEQANNLAWLQGAYIENAVYSAVSYSINGKEAKGSGIKYLEEPIDFSDHKETTEEDVIKAKKESLGWLQQLYKYTNEKFS